MNVKAIPYTPKGKGQSVTFTEMASRNLNVSSNRDTSLTPPGNKLKNNMNKHIVSDSKTRLAKKKTQYASLKEI